MKVLHCIPHVHGGGADIGSVNLVHTLSELDDVSARLCVFLGKQAPQRRIGRLDHPVLLDFRGSHKRPDEFLRFRKALKRVVTAWRPDIVHSHLWPGCRWAASALPGLPVQHVWQIHDTRDWLVRRDVTNRIVRCWTRMLLRRVSPSLIAVSRAAASYSAGPLKFSASSCNIISCGVDPERFQPRAKQARSRTAVIGLAAWFRPEKGHTYLLHALHDLTRQELDVELRLAGSGPLLPEVKELCKQLGLTDRVRFFGHIDDLPKFLAELDLFVLPSRAFEGLPVCLLEAMSMRVPVVATAVGGTPEIVKDGETGWLVPPDDPVALANTIRYALQSQTGPADRRMRDKARQLVVEDHSNQVVAQKVKAVYEEILG